MKLRYQNNKYVREFESLKSYDEVQYIDFIDAGDHKFEFLATAGHGYLIVPRDSKFIDVAKNICTKYGYNGNLAIYLEEDCEAPAFIKQVKVVNS